MSATATYRQDHTTDHRDERPVFILVGGVPGAGKTTLLQGINRSTARTLDPDSYRHVFAHLLPAAPYRSYRPLVHLFHAVATLSWILLGPARPGRRTLLVHNPATRRSRRDLIGRLARRCGWRTILLLVDVDREDALAGQRRRGRVINPESFERHWQRWSGSREQITAAALDEDQLPDWDQVHVVNRQTGASMIDQLLSTDECRY